MCLIAKFDTFCYQSYAAFMTTLSFKRSQANMNVSLTTELEQLVNEKVQSGMYHTASEVVRDALRLLKERDELQRIRRQELRAEIKKGIDQLNAGAFEVHNSPEAILKHIKTEGRKRLSAQRKKSK
jgi:antitoxin ParD1/3/4